MHLLRDEDWEVIGNGRDLASKFLLGVKCRGGGKRYRWKNHVGRERGGGCQDEKWVQGEDAEKCSAYKMFIGNSPCQDWLAYTIYEALHNKIMEDARAWVTILSQRAGYVV
jgi:hypothetical protein